MIGCGSQCYLVVTRLASREAAAVSVHVLCTPYNQTPVYGVTLCKATLQDACVFSCNCRLHFWQNDRDLLRATAVTRGWNGYRNKSQHRKVTLEKNILPPLLPGLEPETFRSRVRSFAGRAVVLINKTPGIHFTQHDLPTVLC